MVSLVLEPQDDAKGGSFADVIDAAAPLKKNWVLVGVRVRGRKDCQSKEMRFVWYRCCLSCFGCGSVFDVFVFSAKFESWFQVARVLQPYHCSLGCKQE